MKSHDTVSILRFLSLVLLFSITVHIFTQYVCKFNQNQSEISSNTNKVNSCSSCRKYNGCHEFDIRITPKQLYQNYFALFNEPNWRNRPAFYSVSFDELHGLLYGVKTPSLYDEWPNFFHKKSDDSYPHTSLSKSLFFAILKQVDIPIHFLVEIGSFWGKSATNIATTLLSQQNWSEFVLLCIDTWDGGSEPWVDSNIRQKMQIRYGRSTAYDQFLANIIAANLTKHVLPYATTSSFAAYFLMDKRIFPQVIYLDSGHLSGETYVEMEMYWALLQPGGIMIGDDWSWPDVRCDVIRFVESNGVDFNVTGNTWYIKKDKKA